MRQHYGVRTTGARSDIVSTYLLRGHDPSPKPAGIQDEITARLLPSYIVLNSHTRTCGEANSYSAW
jgi:hypothetical protein